MDEATARAMIKDHFDTGTDDFARSSEIYADDAVLEFPQGGERIRGKANRLNVVGIMEFRDGKVVRERIYFGEPWEPPAWRAQWVEPMEEPEAPPSSQ